MKQSTILALQRWIYQLGHRLIRHSGPLTPLMVKVATVVHLQLIRLASRRAVPNPVIVGGLTMYHDGRPSARMRMIAQGSHDLQVAEALRNAIHPGMTFLDIGAHIGYFTLLAGREVGAAGHVWAFEALPENLGILRRNVAVNHFDDRTRIVAGAVGDKMGTVRFYSDPADTMYASLYRAAADNRGGDTTVSQAGPAAIDVPSITLDAWAAANQWPKVDFVKIDVEGAEQTVMEGMGELVRRNPAVSLIVEYNLDTIIAAEKTSDSFWDALERLGCRWIRVLDYRPFTGDGDRVRQELDRRGTPVVNLLCRVTARTSTWSDQSRGIAPSNSGWC